MIRNGVEGFWMKRMVLKAAGTALLVAAAVICAHQAASTFPTAVKTELQSYDGAKAEFVLRDYEGYVSVFAPGADPEPLQITAIQTESLRQRDRELLQGGLTVGSREQLLMLLEDLSE